MFVVSILPVLLLFDLVLLCKYIDVGRFHRRITFVAEFVKKISELRNPHKEAFAYVRTYF